MLGRPSLLWKHISIHFRHMVSSFDIFRPMVAMWFPFEPGHCLQVAAFRHADHFGSTEAGGRKAQLGWSWFHEVRYNSSQTKLVIWGLDGGLEVSLRPVLAHHWSLGRRTRTMRTCSAMLQTWQDHYKTQVHQQRLRDYHWQDHKFNISVRGLRFADQKDIVMASYLWSLFSDNMFW